MKNFKKLATILLALVMVLSMATTAFAATTTININGGADGSEYVAWRLFDAEYIEDTQTYKYTIRNQYSAIVKDALGDTTMSDDAALEALAAMTDADEIRTFADNVFADVKAMDPDAEATDNVFAGVEQGYYLIAETVLGNSEDTYSLVMLNTAGEDVLDVTTKEDTPTLDKNITNAGTDGNTEGDTVAVGDTVEFELVADISNKYANYDKYQYTFKDNLSAGLTLCEVNNVKIYIDGDEYTGDKFVKTIEGQTLTVACEDLKQIPEVTASSVIRVTYSATVNENAVNGTDGNTNSATLEYSNDPYNGAGETSETPTSVVKVFTFDTIVDKVDGSKAALEGAGFTLYKYVDGAWEPVGDEITGVTTFVFEGLDSGEYKLVETTVPTGYNKAADIEFEIIATIDEDGELTNLTTDNATVIPTLDADSSEVRTEVVNQFGSTLPSTGGIGTTIFYISGAVLAIAAVVFLVTKKRMSGEEE